MIALHFYLFRLIGWGFSWIGWIHWMGVIVAVWFSCGLPLLERWAVSKLFFTRNNLRGASSKRILQLLWSINFSVRQETTKNLQRGSSQRIIQLLPFSVILPSRKDGFVLYVFYEQVFLQETARHLLENHFITLKYELENA